jgi:hypothetical protein
LASSCGSACSGAAATRLVECKALRFLIKTVILLVAFEDNNTQHVRDFAYDESTVPCLAALL